MAKLTKLANFRQNFVKIAKIVMQIFIEPACEQDEEGGCRNDATKMHNEGRDSIPRNYQERKTAWRVTPSGMNGIRSIMRTDLTSPLVLGGYRSCHHGV